MMNSKNPITSVDVYQGKILFELNGDLQEVKPLPLYGKLKKRDIGSAFLYPVDDIDNPPYVYIYRGKLDPDTPRIPGSIYRTSKKIEIEEHLPESKDQFSFDRCMILNKDNIMQKINDANVEIKQIAPDIITEYDNDVFAPKINTEDDIWKKIVKAILAKMRINIKQLQHHFDNDYDLNNLKAQLIKPGAMSSKYFAKWMEILGVKIEVVITNKEKDGMLPETVTVVMK